MNVLVYKYCAHLLLCSSDTVIEVESKSISSLMHTGIPLVTKDALIYESARLTGLSTVLWKNRPCSDGQG